MNDLELATTDELVMELKKRYPTMICCLHKDPNESNTGEFILYIGGSLTTCLGLCERINDSIWENLSEATEGE